jgi:hypothetical protein
VADGGGATGEGLGELLQGPHRTQSSNFLRLSGRVSPASAELRCGEADRVVGSHSGWRELVRRAAPAGGGGAHEVGEGIVDA